MEALALLGPNLRQQVAGYDDLTALLKMKQICNQATVVSANLIESNFNENINTALEQQEFSLNHHQHQSINLTNQLAAQELPLSKLVFNYVIAPTRSIDRSMDYYFSEIWVKNGDARTSKLPFMSGGPWKLIYATLIYLYLIKLLLPKIMKQFKPVELNWTIRFYNLLMVISNLYAFYHGTRILEFGFKCFGCEVINHSDYSPGAMELLYYGWLFFLSRLVEWLDTIFFVLRKKERQVTKLHVFHHSFVPILCWTYLKFHPGYTVAFFPFVNSFVHSIMYTYYFLATFGPKIQSYLWWKKYLTSLQIAQFVLILIQLATIPLSSSEGCQYPRGFLIVAFAGAILFLWLFYTYYIDTYNKNQQASQNPLKSTYHRINRVKFSSNLREGQSRSLSEAIDNALDSSDPLEETKKFQ